MQAPQASSMRLAPSLEVARALMLDDPALSPRTAVQLMAWSPRDEPFSRQVSFLAPLLFDEGCDAPLMKRQREFTLGYLPELG